MLHVTQMMIPTELLKNGKFILEVPQTLVGEVLIKLHAPA